MAAARNRRTGPFGSLQQRNAEIRNGASPHLTIVDEADHLAPGFLNRGTGLVGPIELIEVEMIDAHPAQ